MSKILTTLELVRRQLDTYFKNADPRADDWVVLSNLVDADGRAYEGARDRVVLFLANITHETTISTFQRTVPANADTYAATTPPIYVDLHLMFYANFSERNYPVGLAMISGTISFFQQNPWFNHQNLPDLDPTIDKLLFQMSNLGPYELNQLMGIAGVKYLPSVFYKVRMIPFAGDVMKSEVPAVTGLRAPGDVADSV